MIKPSSARQRHLDLVVGALMPAEQMPDGLSVADIAPRQMQEIERILDDTIESTLDAHDKASSWEG